MAAVDCLGRRFRRWIAAAPLPPSKLARPLRRRSHPPPVFVEDDASVASGSLTALKIL